MNEVFADNQCLKTVYRASSAYSFDHTLDGALTAKKMETMRTLGVPYTDADIAGAQAAVAGKTELEALIAYLQNLGTVIKTRR